MSLIVILYIFDCVPEMTGENIGKEYLRQADRKSIADKGNLKVAPAKSESGCGEILFGEERNPSVRKNMIGSHLRVPSVQIQIQQILTSGRGGEKGRLLLK